MSNPITTVLDGLRTKINRKQGELESARNRHAAVVKALAQHRVQLAGTLEAQSILVEVAKAVQTEVRTVVESIVSQCLSAVFGDNAYRFEIEFVTRRSRSEADFWLIRDGLRLEPTGLVGGGVVDVVSFGLRLAALVLSKTKRRLIIADEPFKFVSAEYRHKVRDMLQMLSDDLGVQLIYVTHVTEYAMGNIHTLGRTDSDHGTSD